MRCIIVHILLHVRGIIASIVCMHYWWCVFLPAIYIYLCSDSSEYQVKLFGIPVHFTRPHTLAGMQ